MLTGWILKLEPKLQLLHFPRLRTELGNVGAPARFKRDKFPLYNDWRQTLQTLQDTERGLLPAIFGPYIWVKPHLVFERRQRLEILQTFDQSDVWTKRQKGQRQKEKKTNRPNDKQTTNCDVTLFHTLVVF